MTLLGIANYAITVRGTIPTEAPTLGLLPLLPVLEDVTDLVLPSTQIQWKNT